MQYIRLQTPRIYCIGYEPGGPYAQQQQQLQPVYNPLLLLIILSQLFATQLHTSHLHIFTSLAPPPQSAPQSAPAIMTQDNTISLDYYVTKAGTIPRLTHSNFAIWSNAVKYALIGNDAWNIVDASEEAPEVNGSQRTRDEYRKYVKRSNKAEIGRAHV